MTNADILAQVDALLTKANDVHASLHKTMLDLHFLQSGLALVKLELQQEEK